MNSRGRGSEGQVLIPPDDLHILVDRLGRLEGERHRLFGIRIPPRLACGDVDDRVPVVGRAVGDDVDVLTIQQAAIVLIDGGFAAKDRLGPLGVGQVHVADGHDVAENAGLLGHARAAPADADAPDARAVVL